MVTVDPHQPPPAAMMPPRLGAPQPPVAPASATEGSLNFELLNLIH